MAGKKLSAEGRDYSTPSSSSTALDAAEVTRKRAREVETVTAEEVDEFCAILRRMRRPVRYFGSRESSVVAGGGGGGRAKRWQPSFVAEDFKDEEKEEKKCDDAGRRGLDLNEDPLAE